MIEVTTENWIEMKQDTKLVFVHTPFCATCQLAERMLAVVEETDPTTTIYRLNASFFPEFMKANKIQSVPALLLIDNLVVIEGLYAFESVTNIYEHMYLWKQNQSI